MVYAYKADTVSIHFVSQCRKDVMSNFFFGGGGGQLNIRLTRTSHFHTSICPVRVCVSLLSRIAFVQLVRVSMKQSTFALNGQICRRRQPTFEMVNKEECYRHHWTRHT